MTRAKPTTRRRKTVRHKRHPHDWYVEPSWAVEAIIPVLAPMLRRWFDRILGSRPSIWDPCCGKGTTPITFRKAGFEAYGTDLVDRGAPRSVFDDTLWLGTLDFFSTDNRVRQLDRMSIISNPPYKRTEEFVRRALQLTRNVVAVVVPLNFLCSGGRFALFMEEHPPLQLVFLSDRPSMPPGDKIEEMGDKAFTGGTIDYVWIIWDNHRPGVRLAPLWVRKPEDAA